MASDATTQAEVDRLAKERAVLPNEATLEEENPWRARERPRRDGPEPSGVQ